DNARTGQVVAVVQDVDLTLGVESDLPSRGAVDTSDEVASDLIALGLPGAVVAVGEDEDVVAMAIALVGHLDQTRGERAGRRQRHVAVDLDCARDAPVLAILGEEPHDLGILVVDEVQGQHAPAAFAKGDDARGDEVGDRVGGVVDVDGPKAAHASGHGLRVVGDLVEGGQVVDLGALDAEGAFAAAAICDLAAQQLLPTGVRIAWLRGDKDQLNGLRSAVCGGEGEGGTCEDVQLLALRLEDVVVDVPVVGDVGRGDMCPPRAVAALRAELVEDVDRAIGEDSSRRGLEYTAFGGDVKLWGLVGELRVSACMLRVDRRGSVFCGRVSHDPVYTSGLRAGQGGVRPASACPD